MTQAIGLGEIQFELIGASSTPVGDMFPINGIPVGLHGILLALTASSCSQCQPPISFAPGSYQFLFGLCQGQCGSSHATSKYFGNMTGTFTITA